ncbi:MAG: peptidyl-prolyl cis-trans isomerase [Chloroflexi bacterium]|nr:MAG: peptidyl-prolyl cis-trans isomerase [Chloroflexota bacterium]
MKGLLREPLLHFLLLGAGLFVALDLVGKGSNGDPGRIVVTQGQIEHIAATFARVHERLPDPPELEALIRDHVREEVYVREALALGLDRDDTIIRQRLRQKVEFLSEDVAASVEPTDADLQAYLTAHPETFRVERRFTFSHVYLNPERRRDSLARDATQLLARLKQAGAGADLAALGDPFLLDHEFNRMAASDVVQQFGERFATKLGELPLGEWQGPLESGYGAHLVLVNERTEGRLPALGEVRDSVRREWQNVQRLEANEKFFQGLLDRYTVVVEQERPVHAEGKIAAVKPR